MVAATELLDLLDTGGSVSTPKGREGRGHFGDDTCRVFDVEIFEGVRTLQHQIPHLGTGLGGTRQFDGGEPETFWDLQQVPDDGRDLALLHLEHEVPVERLGRQRSEVCAGVVPLEGNPDVEQEVFELRKGIDKVEEFGDRRGVTGEVEGFEGWGQSVQMEEGNRFAHPLPRPIVHRQ